jgi:hypothetical protein
VLISFVIKPSGDGGDFGGWFASAIVGKERRKEEERTEDVDGEPKIFGAT